MLHRWLFHEPSLSFGVPVFVCATAVFPLHLGWIGTSVPGFIAYLVVAAVLFSLADALLHPYFYARWEALVAQACICMCGLVVPAALMFAVGSAFGPVDEALDEEVCASQGAREADSVGADADDTFDVTADCIVET